MARTKTRPLRVELLAYEGCFAVEIFGILDVLTIANTVSRALRPGVPEPFAAQVVSVRGSSVGLAGEARLQTARAGAAVDLVVVPGAPLDAAEEFAPHLARWPREIAYLRDLGPKTRVASVCLGAFLVAEAGLLTGRRATTSWLYAAEFARRYPDIDVHTTAMVVRDGPVMTAGAFSAVHDLALHLVEQHAGAAAARMTSKLTLVSPGRSSQGPFVVDELVPVAHARFSDDVKRTLQRGLAERYDLEQLAAAHHVSSRTLLRRFAAETGESPLACLRAMRVATAKRLLERSDLSVAEITAQVGYTDAATFRALFLDHVGVTPSEYRRQVALAS